MRRRKFRRETLLDHRLPRVRIWLTMTSETATAGSRTRSRESTVLTWI
jgi:hypothetical protein